MVLKNFFPPQKAFLRPDFPPGGGFFLFFFGGGKKGGGPRLGVLRGFLKKKLRFLKIWGAGAGGAHFMGGGGLQDPGFLLIFSGFAIFVGWGGGGGGRAPFISLSLGFFVFFLFFRVFPKNGGGGGKIFRVFGYFFFARFIFGEKKFWVPKFVFFHLFRPSTGQEAP